MTPPEPHESARAMYAYHLKRLREEHDLSQPALGKKVHVSGSLISGIETCMRTPSPKLSAAFDATLGIPHFFSALQPRVIEEIGLPAGFPEYTDAEAEASVLRLYDSFAINGLLQQEGYARALLGAAARGNRLEQLVAARMTRQEILSREESPMVISLIDEYALRRPYGSSDVMRKQYEHLLQLADEQRIALHVVPAAAGFCPEGSFSILSSAEGHDVGYVESAGGKGQFIEAGPDFTDLAVLYELIRNKALSDTGTVQLIHDLLERT